MEGKQILSLAALVLFFSSSLFSQSLAEIARKERERRASLKGKKGIVVTNAELAKLKKKAALSIKEPAYEEKKEELEAQEAVPLAENALPEDHAQPVQPTPGQTSGNPPSGLEELQEKYNKAKEYVELLTLKMGALWQQYYGLENTTSREAIQLAISETFLKLEKAQEEETSAQQELENYLRQAKKEASSPIWIK